MSQKEFQRVKVIENAAGGRLSVREASRLLQLSERQVQRLKRRYQPDSVGWVQHGNRGRPMPWALPVPQKQLILTLAREQISGLQRFSSGGKTSRRGEPRGQPRDRAPHLARRQTGLSPETAATKIPLPPLAPSAFWHDGPHRRQPSRLARRPRPHAHPHRLSGRCRPARSSPLTSNSNPKILVGYLRALARHDHHPRRSAQPLPRPPLHLPAQRSPLDSRRTTRRQTIAHPTRTRPRRTRHRSRSPPTLLKPRAASSAPGAPARTVWSANFASPALPLCPRPMPRSPASAPITISASPVPPQNRPATSAACRDASISPAASACTIAASSPPITPSPWARTPSPCHPCPASAAMPEKPSSSLTTWTAGCTSIAETSFCSPCLCF